MTYKRPLCFPFSENLLDIVSWFLFFCVTSSVSGTQSKGRFFFLIPILRVLSHLLHKQTKPFLTRKGNVEMIYSTKIDIICLNLKTLHSKATTVKSYYNKTRRKNLKRSVIQSLTKF